MSQILLDEIIFLSDQQVRPRQCRHMYIEVKSMIII